MAVRGSPLRRAIAKRLAFAELRQLPSVDLPAVRLRRYIDLASRHDIQRVAGIAGVEENLTIIEMAGADAGQNSFDLFGWQMTQQIAFREQLNRFLRVLLLASEGILAKPCRVAYCGPLLVEEQGCEVVDDGTEGEAYTDKRPGRIGVEPLTMQFLSAFEGQFYCQRTDQGTRGKSEDASQHALGERNVQTKSSPDNRRRGCQKSQQRNDNDFAQTDHRCLTLSYLVEQECQPHSIPVRFLRLRKQAQAFSGGRPPPSWGVKSLRFAHEWIL